MEPTLELIEALDREDVEQARRQSFAQKFLAGAELFDYACDVSKSGIRWQNPHFTTEEQVMAELRRRLALGDRLAEIEL